MIVGEHFSYLLSLKFDMFIIICVYICLVIEGMISLDYIYFKCGSSLYFQNSLVLKKKSKEKKSIIDKNQSLSHIITCGFGFLLCSCRVSNSHLKFMKILRNPLTSRFAWSTPGRQSLEDSIFCRQSDLLGKL